MTDVNFLYDQAELAMAAYAKLELGSIDEFQRVILQNSGFSSMQSQKFALRYEVVTQYDDPNDSGFSAIVFSDTSGNLSLAIRGTELWDLGDDVIVGSGYADDYLFNLGDGHDVITDVGSSSSSNRDELKIEQSNLSIEDLWFSRSDDNLLINLVGTQDQITVSNWFASQNNQIESISIGSSVLVSGKVDQLINAMASYDVPSGNGTIIPAEVLEELQPVLANTWQSV